MIYPENLEDIIGVNTVRQFIKEKCLSSLGEERVETMSFSTDYNKVQELLNQTNEFLLIIRNNENFPTDNFIDNREVLVHIIEDITAWFSETELFELMKTLVAVQDIVHFLDRLKNDKGVSKYPFLNRLANQVQTFPLIIDKIVTVLDSSSGVLKDNATSRLSSIRKDIREATKHVERCCQKALRDAQDMGLIDKGTQMSLRDGLMVLPIMAANKRKLKGKVHDGSASGKTVFIEPDTVADANHRLRELEADERREMVKILIDVTDFIRPQIKSLVTVHHFLAEVDFIRAKAYVCNRFKATMPKLENRPLIHWNEAIHPLLNIELKKLNKSAKPLNIRLNDENRLLLISGANAGGKSLCLKTVVLLQYMLQCGMLIPIAKNSTAGIFDHIFIDIGDGQSIANSLSTYTSHLINMKYFVENCTDKTLLLIDEFGSGTEPQIGGAIAETLLDRINAKKSYGVITTHFHSLKYFAYKTDGIINGAMLYDSIEMRPLYKLAIGQPGSSYALEVARKIGLSEDIIVESSSKVEHEYDMSAFVMTDLSQDEEPEVIEVKHVNEVVEVEPLVDSEVISPIVKGSRVRLDGERAIGVVHEVKNKRVVVMFGPMKTTVTLDRLKLV